MIDEHGGRRVDAEASNRIWDGLTAQEREDRVDRAITWVLAAWAQEELRA